MLIRPLSGAVGWDTNYAVEGQLNDANPNGNYEAISPDYFRTMGIQLVAGRDFAASDTDKSPGVVIIDEATAKRHWPAGDAVGHRLRLGRPNAPWLMVVGVVRPVRYRQWEAAWPDFYVPYTQRAQHRTDFVVKTKGDPEALAQAVRREVFAADRNQPVSNLTTMDALVDRALARSKFNGASMAALAAMRAAAGGDRDLWRAVVRGDAAVGGDRGAGVVRCDAGADRADGRGRRRAAGAGRIGGRIGAGGVV